jgi:uncharacterized protein YbcI
VSDTETHRRPADSLPAAISRHVVRLFAEYTGRGPTKARTTIRDTLVVCLTEDTMTKAERRLVQEGEDALVVTIRRKFQTTMRDDLIGDVEMLTGRKVLSFMSDHDANHDYAAEVFVLDGPRRRPRKQAARTVLRLRRDARASQVGAEGPADEEGSRRPPAHGCGLVGRLKTSPVREGGPPGRSWTTHEGRRERGRSGA